MKLFGLTGYPLGHSLSPVIHKELMKIREIQGAYSLYEVSPQELGEKIPVLKKDLCGFNVTIPHKVDIIPFLDELDEKAALFGAVNTVSLNGETAKGYNTDCVGFLRALDAAGIELGGKVLLCGAGGVARMFAFEAALAGSDLTIAARDADISAAEKIKNEISEKLGKNCSVINLRDVKDGYDLIINGTPVGMFPNTNACVLDKGVVEKSSAVFDAIYNPRETLLLKYAKEAGLKYSNGLSMLVLQAAAAQEIWNGVEFSNTDINGVIKIIETEPEKI